MWLLFELIQNVERKSYMTRYDSVNKQLSCFWGCMDKCSQVLITDILRSESCHMYMNKHSTYPMLIFTHSVLNVGIMIPSNRLELLTGTTYPFPPRKWNHFMMDFPGSAMFSLPKFTPRYQSKIDTQNSHI